MLNVELIYGLLALLGVFMTATALPAAGIVAVRANRSLHSWALLLSAIAYSLAYLLEPPIPVRYFFQHGAMDTATAIRYMLLGLTLLLVWNEYVHSIRRGRQARVACDAHLAELDAVKAELAKLKGDL